MRVRIAHHSGQLTIIDATAVRLLRWKKDPLKVSYAVIDYGAAEEYHVQEVGTVIDVSGEDSFLFSGKET